MAQQNVIVKLSLKDQEVVRRGLEQVGVDGERALKRIDAAGRAPSAGLKALGAASDELRGSLGNLAGSAGSVGTALQALGPTGLAAAAGIGAIAVAIAGMLSQLRANAEYFGKLNDQAERLGVTAEKLQALGGAAMGAGVDADQMAAALERLNDAIGAAIGGDEQAIAKFERVGVSLGDITRAGGDTHEVLLLVSDGMRGLGTTAERTAAAHDLFGKSAGALIPVLASGRQEIENQEDKARSLGLVLGDDLVKAYDELGDAMERLGTVARTASGQIFAPLVEGATGWVNMVADLVNKTRMLAKAAQEGDWGTIQFLTSGGRSGSKFVTGGGFGGEEPTPEQAFKALTSGVSAKFPTLRMAPDSGGGGAKKAGRAAAEPKLSDFEFGKPFEAEITSLNALSEDALTATQRNAQETMQHIVEAHLRATGEVVKLIEMRRDNELNALNLVALSEEDKAQARVMINQTADAEIAKANARLTETTEKTSVAALTLSDTFQGFGQVASSAFEDAIIKGEKFSTVMEGLTQDIQHLLIRNTMNKFLELGLNALATIAGGAFGGPAGGMATGVIVGTALGGSQGGYQMSGSSEFLVAHGAAFDRGNVIPFARGGVVDRPTLFPMAHGAGLMGEAGPEAVMPLTRLPGGKLGVGASGGGPLVNVQVINNTGASVRTEETKNGRGGVDLKVVIDAVEDAMAQRMTRPGTNLNKALATASSPVRAR